MFSTIPISAVASEKGRQSVKPESLNSSTLAQVTFDPSFVQGVQGESIDLSQFEHGNPVLPGTYRPDVYLNARLVGRDTIVIRTDVPSGAPKICFTRALFERFNVDFGQLDKDVLARLADADACVDIRQAIPGATATFDSATQRLDVTIPQIALRRTARGYVSPELWDKGVTAGMLGYTANVYRNVTRGVSQDSGYVGLNGGLNVGGWYFRHNGSFNWTQGGERRYRVANTYVQRDITPWQARVTVGDANSTGDIFDTFAFRGVQLATDDRMLPESLRGYAPIVRGIADTNARVTIRQNGAILYDTTVPPGPFEIDDLYPTGYGGNLDVTVTEADGRIRTFNVPYAAIPQLLRPGALRYSVVAGTVRNMNLSYTPRVAQATIQRGITNDVTLYGGVLANNDYASVLGGGAFNTPIGAVAVDVSGARTSVAGQSLSGTSIRATYSKLFEPTSSNVSLAAYRFSSSGFLDFNGAMYFSDAARRGLPAAESIAVWRPRSRVSVALSQPLGGQAGQLYLTGYSQNYWQRPGSDTQFQAGYSNRFRSMTYSLSISRSRLSGGVMDTQYMLSLSVPLGKGAQAPQMGFNFGHGTASGTTAQATVSGLAGDNNQFTYNAAAGRDTTQTVSGSVGGQYRSPYATVGATYGQGAGFQNGSLSLSGAVVAHPGGITATPYASETMAVVSAPAAGGAAVQSYPGIRLDARGYAVVPYLTPYRLNEIILDPKGLPLDVELQSTSQQVAPLSGAVVMLKYPTVTGMPVLIKSQMSDGEPLPFGARVQDMQGNNVGTVSQGGRIYARIARSNENLTVQWGDGDARMCKINVALPEQPGKAGVGAAFARLQAPCVVDTKARYLGKSPRLLKPADVSTRPGAPRASIAAPATPAS